MREKKLAYRVAETVTPGGSGFLSRRIPKDGTIDKVYVRIYPGAGLALRLRPVILSADGRTKYDIIDYTGKQYIDGDDDIFEFDVDEPIGQDQSVGVVYSNTDLVNTLDFSVDFIVDHLGGTSRVGGGGR